MTLYQVHFLNSVEENDRVWWTEKYAEEDGRGKFLGSLLLHQLPVGAEENYDVRWYLIRSRSSVWMLWLNVSWLNHSIYEYTGILFKIIHKTRSIMPLLL
jgi:hypothetical protein